jgi:hypothetical protein
LIKNNTLLLKREMKNGMALENFNLSDLYYHGTGSVFLYYLEAEPSRPKMVRVHAKM